MSSEWKWVGGGVGGGEGGEDMVGDMHCTYKSDGGKVSKREMGAIKKPVSMEVRRWRQQKSFAVFRLLLAVKSQSKLLWTKHTYATLACISRRPQRSFRWLATSCRGKTTSKTKRIHCKGIEPLAEAIDLPIGNQTVSGKLLCYHYTNSVFHIRFLRNH